MTFMPKFKQHAAGLSHEYRTSPKTELLGQRSRDGLALILKERDLAAPASVYKARLESELQVIEAISVCDYFLIVADYVQWAKDNGIAVGPGRGSGPCSLAGFALGITNVDPIKYDLPFERFVNPERNLVPDFDLDFCGQRIGEITAYLQSRYGADRVAQISCTNTFPLPERLVIADRPLDQLVPLYANSVSGILATKLTIKQIADAGLVQFNAINQNALTHIQHRVQQLAKSNIIVELDNIMLDDSATYQLLAEGEPSRIDALDGAHYKATLKAVQPESFEQLCAVIAQCFPRFQDSLSLYLERRQNPESVRYYHPALESITADTFGVIIYQEQLMHIIHKMAGFSMTKADLFRRAIKASDNKAMSVYKNDFIDGAVEFGLSKTEAVDLLDYVRQSGQNLFNKSHAVAFAMIAYQTAWLKANDSHVE